MESLHQRVGPVPPKSPSEPSETPGHTNHSPQPLSPRPFSFGPQVKNDVCVF